MLEILFAFQQHFMTHDVIIALNMTNLFSFICVYHLSVRPVTFKCHWPYVCIISCSSLSVNVTGLRLWSQNNNTGNFRKSKVRTRKNDRGKIYEVHNGRNGTYLNKHTRVVFLQQKVVVVTVCFQTWRLARSLVMPCCYSALARYTLFRPVLSSAVQR